MKKNILRFLMALVAVMTSANMLAENKLWIQQYAVSADVFEFAVMMNNDESISALQFNLVVPEELTVLGDDKKEVYANPERLHASQQFMCAEQRHNVFKCAVFANRNDSFIGQEGPLAFFKVARKNSTIDFSKPLTMSLEEIIFSEYNGTNPGNYDTSWTGDVTVNAAIEITSSVETKVVNPGTAFTVPVDFLNSEQVQGMQMDIQLPEGFVLTDNFVKTSRMSDGAGFNLFAHENGLYRLIIADLTGAYAVRNPGNGEIFSMEIQAPETIAEGSALEIVIKDVIASAGAVSYPGTGTTVGLVDGGIAYAKAKAEIEALKADFAAAAATIAETCPLVKDNFKGEAVEASIKALEAAVEAAYADFTLTPDYDKVMAPAAEIKTSIEALVADAKAAQEAEETRVADNKAKYDAAVVALDALQTRLDEAVKVIDEEYADFKDAEAIAAVQAKIDEAREAALKAFEAVAAEGVFEYAVDEEGLTAAINALVDDAKAAKDKAEGDAEAERQAANKAAYEKDLAAIDELLASYRAVVAEIQANYPEYENVSAELTVRNNLDDAKYQVEKAYKAVAEEGVYSYELDVEGLQASIDKLLADAKAGAEQAEADRVAANQAAYDAVVAEIEALKAEEEAAIDKIIEMNPDYNFAVEVRAIDMAIREAEEAADAAYAAVAEAGVFEFTFDAEAIRAMISKMIDNATLSAVEALEMEVSNGNARIFTLDGKQHARPVAGEINVIVRKNGNVSKVMVE